MMCFFAEGVCASIRARACTCIRTYSVGATLYTALGFQTIKYYVRVFCVAVIPTHIFL